MFKVDPDTLHGRRAIENAAILCHEANRGYCAAIGDDTQVPWTEAQDWQRDSALVGVRAVLADPSITAEDLHKSWLEQKEKDGWALGEVKDVEKKTHPCMVPYADLPKDQRHKDVIFGQTARAALYVYGMRFARLYGDEYRKAEVNLWPWKCSDQTFDVGMYVFTGRASIVADRVLGWLAIELGQRVSRASTRHRNAELSQQIYCAMLSKDATAAYGLYAAQKWPLVISAFKQREHWHVLYALVHAMMGIEGVVAHDGIPANRWTYQDPKTGDESSIEVMVHGTSPWAVAE